MQQVTAAQLAAGRLQLLQEYRTLGHTQRLHTERKLISV